MTLRFAAFVAPDIFTARFGPWVTRKTVKITPDDKEVKNPSRGDTASPTWWGRIWAEPMAVMVFRPRAVKLFTPVPPFRAIPDVLREVTKKDRTVFIREVKKGVAPSKAARVAGFTLKQIMEDDLVRAEVDKIIREFSLPAERRRLLVRALANKAALAAARDGDAKSLGAFLKLIGDDPEVGIGGAKPSALVSVSMGSMSPQVEAVHREALAELQDVKSVGLKMLEAGESQVKLPPGTVPPMVDAEEE